MFDLNNLDLLMEPDNNPKRILVTGSRIWTDYYLLGRALMDELRGHSGSVVVHGSCPTGADEMASRWVKYWIAQVPFGSAIYEERHPADWSKGRSAGPIRNQKMVSLGADICLGFVLPGSRGTLDCLQRANKAGIPTKVFGETS